MTEDLSLFPMDYTIGQSRLIDGRLCLDIEDEGTIILHPKQGYTVPRGIVHRTRAEEPTVMLMVEANTVDPKGD